MILTRANVQSEVRRLAEIVTKSQLLAERARQAGDYSTTSAYQKRAAACAGDAVALNRTLGTSTIQKAPEAPSQGSVATGWVDDLMQGFTQTATGWIKNSCQSAPRPAPARTEDGGAAGLYGPVTRKVSPVNRENPVKLNG